jgi:hypothetical protein
MSREVRQSHSPTTPHMDDKDDEMDFDELIERSSFGSPEVKATRACTPSEVTAEILAGLRREVGGGGSQSADPP